MGLLEILEKTLNAILKIVIFLNYNLWKYKVEEDCIISSSIPKDNLLVNGIKGGQYLSAVHIKTNAEILKITTKNGCFVKCSVNHLFYDSNMQIIDANNVTRQTFLITKQGISRVVKVEKLPRQFTFDVTVGSGEMSYFSNDILSHNSITSGIFIMWYLLTNYDKGVACTSATDDKVKELIEKIDTIYDNLPFYMKLGICVDNQKRKIYDNGCSIKGETATEKAGAGLTVNGILYCDEFALIDPQVLKIFYQTIFPTMSSSKTAKMIITSTARGRNLFWQLYTDGLLGKNYFNPIRVDWFDVEGRDDKWKQEETANIGSEEAFEQEYGNSFDTNQQLLLPSDVMKSLKSYQSHFTNNRLSNAS